MKVTVVLVFVGVLSSLGSVQCKQSRNFDKYEVLRMEPAAFASARAASNSGGPKSPLLELVLRILDTIQIVPKARSRRHVRSSDGPSPLFGRTLFGGRAEQPLLALSLESSETAPALAEDSWGADDDGDADDDDGDDDEDDDDFHRTNDYPAPVRPASISSTAERFYDMVLDVLQVLESQARQQVQRARVQLETLDLATSDGSEEYSLDEEQPD